MFISLIFQSINNNYTFNTRNTHFPLAAEKTMEIIPVRVAAHCWLIYLSRNLLTPGDFYIVELVIRLSLMRNRYNWSWGFKYV